jgi:hypothetical protein
MENQHKSNSFKSNFIEKKEHPNLFGLGRIKGQLHPLSRKDSKMHKTEIGLSTDFGQEFYVLGQGYWKLATWKHIWEQVVLKGEIDYSKKIVRVQSLIADEAFCFDDPEPFDDVQDLSDADYYADLVRRGIPIPQTA